MSIFIVGCGYLGERVAAKISSSGVETHALTRQEERAQEFQRRGWHAHRGDWLQSSSLSNLPRVDTLLVAVTHRAVEGVPPQQTHILGLTNLFAALPKPWPRIVYISTTGVYAQDDGDWVNEDSHCQPTRPGGIAALSAEDWLIKQFGNDVTVLRMAGLYGPDRIPNAERMRQKAALNPQDHTYLNLIHIEDAAGYCVEALQRNHPQTRYLVADGTPIRRSHYYQFLLDFLKIDSQSLAVDDSPSPLPRRSESNKRIDVSRLQHDFSYRCRYADFREGIKASCAEP